MNDATRVPAPVNATDEIPGSLKVRGLELVDDAGRTRISLTANTDGSADGSAGVYVYHPRDDATGSAGDHCIQSYVSLEAGLDTESDGYTRAGLLVSDGATLMQVDVDHDTAGRARVAELERRVDRLERVLSLVGGLLGLPLDEEGVRG